MIWLAAALFLMAAICLIRMHVYKRQIRNICRQLVFHRKHGSNIMVTHDMYSREMKELISVLNESLVDERTLRRTYEEKEQRSNNTISGLSHDIRTPLTSLDGYYQLLADCQDEDRRRRYLAIIGERIHSLKALIEELFLYTKLQNRSYEMKLSKIDINQLAFDTVFSFFDDFTRKGIVPEIQLSETPVYIQGNEIACKRVMENIIKNALEHGCNEFAVGLARQDDQIHLRFANHCEKPMEIEIERVFEHFYKADAARSGSSTGLGLSIAKELIERMGGTISAQMQGGAFSVLIVFPAICA